MTKTLLGRLFGTASKSIMKSSLFKVAEDKQKYLTKELKKIFSAEFLVEAQYQSTDDKYVTEQYSIYYIDEATNKRHALTIVSARELIK